MKTISSALVKARRQFGPALKDKANPHFRSRYADLGACLDAVDDALLAEGIALAQETDDCADGVKVRTVLIHESGERLDFGWLHVPAVKNDPQGYGSALTYARRYSLMAACGIAPEDDDGNAAANASRNAQQRHDARPSGRAAQQDNSPKARAQRIVAGVTAGDAAGAAAAIASWPQDEIDAVWGLLPPAITDKLTAAWPKEPA